MALVFPRTDIIPFATYQPPYKFKLQERQELSRQANGVTRGVDFGTPIWMGEYRTTMMPLPKVLQFEAMLSSLNGAMRTFEAYDIRRPFPLLRDGYAAGGTINALGSDNRSLRVAGLPSGMVLSIGDYFSYTLNGVRWLHRVLEAATAAGTGITPLIEVEPYFPQGIAIGVNLNFARPSALMSLEPGSVSPEMDGRVNGVVSFRAYQVL